jgi:alpha-glucosidase
MAAAMIACEDAPDESLVEACDFLNLPAATPVPAEARSWAAGSFTVTRGRTGGILVANADDPGHDLFELRSAGDLVALRADLSVQEHQGAFDVQETINATCRATDEAMVRSDGANLVLEGGFDSDDPACAGLGWQMRICEPRIHHLSIIIKVGGDADAVRFLAASNVDEAVFGLGEQFPRETLDLKGRVVPILVQEQGIGRGEPGISAVMEALAPGSSGSEQSTHHPVPHVLTSQNRSFFLDNTEYAVFDLSRDDAIDVRVHADEVRIGVIHGRTPLELIERFTRHSGRMRQPPAWLDEGAILALAREPDEALAITDDLLARGARISAVWTQTWCGTARTVLGEQVLWNWTARPGWDGYVQALGEKDVRALCYVNPMFRDLPADADPNTRNLYREAVENGYGVLTGDGEPYLLKQGVFDVALLDLSNPEARDWMKAVLKDEMLAAGCMGWMADFAEALPFDGVLASGEGAAGWHNRYPEEWARLNREALEEAGVLDQAMVFHRSGFTRTPSYSGMQWHGDNTVTWDRYDGMESALHGLLNGGFSGISLNHSDAGGYTVVPLVDPPVERTPELLMRWVEMNAFTALLRTHEGNQPARNTQVYSDDIVADHFARFTRVFAGLAPIRRALFAQAADRGWPVVRHMALHHPDLPGAWQVHDQFLLGPDILVAPVLVPCEDQDRCTVSRLVWLPQDSWVHLWSGDVFEAPPTGLDISIDAPLGRPPVFLRLGTETAATVIQALKDAGVDGVADLPATPTAPDPSQAPQPRPFP